MKRFRSVLKKTVTGVCSAVLLTGALLPGSFAQAEEEDFTGEADIFIAFGGSGEEAGEWGLSYAGEGAAYEGSIKATDGKIKVGDTVTVSLEMPEAVSHMYYMAPVIVAEGISGLEADVSVKFDGKETAIDFSQGKAWWYEGTGDYSDKQSIRLAGGYNEWAAQYISHETGWTKVEYTVTLKSAKTGGEELGDPYDGEFSAFIAIGADKEADGDWGYGFTSTDPKAAGEGITAVTKEGIKVGDTFTVSLEFEPETLGVWYMAPVLLAENIGALEADIACKINDEDVAIDFTKDEKLFWYEETGDYTADQAIRLAGGYNEWGTAYIEKPTGIKKVEYTVTVKSANLKAGEEGSSAGPVDKKGKYNAYIGLQTPKYSFRDAWYAEKYGLDYTDDTGMDYFHQITAWDEDNNAVKVDGSFEDAQIAGNGHYSVKAYNLGFGDDEFADQEYMNLIYLDTDIPNTNEVEITNVKLLVDGNDVEINPIISPDSKDYLTILIQNIWNSEVKTVGYYPVPMKEMVIEFDVAGFDYDAEAEAATEAPKENETTDAKNGGSEDKTEAASEAATQAPKNDDKKADADSGKTPEVIAEKKGLPVGAIVAIAGVCLVAVGGAAAYILTKKKQ